MGRLHEHFFLSRDQSLCLGWMCPRKGALPLYEEARWFNYLIMKVSSMPSV